MDFVICLKFDNTLYNLCDVLYLGPIKYIAQYDSVNQ